MLSLKTLSDQEINTHFNLKETSLKRQANNLDFEMENPFKQLIIINGLNRLLAERS